MTFAPARVMAAPRRATTRQRRRVAARGTAMSRFGPSFTAATTRRLARQGFRGATLVVVLTDDVVGLVGAEGGDRPIPLAGITGLRAGLIRGKGGNAPELRLFVAGEADPVMLYPVKDAGDAAASRRDYAAFVRALAGRLAASGRAAMVEVGSGRLWACVSTTLLALPALAMVAVFVWTVSASLPETERWIAPLVTGGAAAGLTALASWWWRAHWPRRVCDPCDLDRVLRP